MTDITYHPHRAFRFFNGEPFIYCVKQSEALNEEAREEGRPSAGLSYATDMILDLFGAELENQALPGLIAYLADEGQSLESAVEGFARHGSNIFDVSPLVEMFRQTSVDEIAVADLQLPFKEFYLHFGEEAGIPSPHESVVVEGCYVDLNEIPGDEHIMLDFVCSFPGAEQMEAIPPLDRFLRFARGYACMLPLRETIPEAIAFASDRSWCESAPWWRNYLAEPMRAAINALCYLGYDGREIEQVWPKGAPARLVKQASSTKPTEQRRAISKLAALGYSVINLCGRHQATTLPGSANGASPRTHWRRGHWRRQAVGPARSQRRLMWIRPTMVAGGTGEEVAVGGHLYQP